MTKAETAEIMVKAKDSFQKWRDISKVEFAQMIVTWHELLEDMPYEMAKQAMSEYIRENNYPPTVADIYRPYKEYKDQLKADKREAINIYYRAIANYPCYEDTPEIQSEYMRIIGKTPDPDKARRFETRLIAFVRKHEESKEPIPPLIKYLKGVKQIE
jgi:hypothetical protein